MTLPAIFSDNMVLQQNASVNLWGKAAPGERVTVKASWATKPATVETAADGKWTVKLKTPGAIAGQSVEVSHLGKYLRLTYEKYLRKTRGTVRGGER